jgi:hypothetical protein
MDPELNAGRRDVIEPGKGVAKPLGPVGPEALLPPD